jgi:hypothetical protein
VKSGGNLESLSLAGWITPEIESVIGLKDGTLKEMLHIRSGNFDIEALEGVNLDLSDLLTK